MHMTDSFSLSFSNAFGNAPGKLPSNKSDYRLEDLSLLPMPVLLETLDRQNKLLSNRLFIARLPDNGSRIMKFKGRLEEELAIRKSKRDLCEVISGLTLNGKEISDSLEWEGKFESPEVTTSYKPTMKDVKNEIDSEKNLLEILATHSSTSQNKIQTRVLDEAESLIKPSDGDCEEKINNDPYVLNLCKKFDSIKTWERFLPHKTLVSTQKETCRIKPEKERELSAATPPSPKHSNVIAVSLEQSLDLQFQQSKRLKEIQIKHAAERLKDKSYLIGEKLPPIETLTVYRDSPAGSDSECEVGDECEPEDSGGVVFTITE
ncbi:hypothetical protein AAG570_011504 [Ranatra chinensis]|uniref:Uncharacterized protein n=1 Tax=Ranatra chinensis TaxID=642074 RepID=A0ABD0Z309_9HEMI